MRATLASLLLPLAGFCQVQSQVQPATTGATFTSSTQLIVEEVSVKDRKGKVIQGLKKEDFVITEDGRPQEIRFFDFEDIERAADASGTQPGSLPAPKILFQLTRPASRRNARAMSAIRTGGYWRSTST